MCIYLLYIILSRISDGRHILVFLVNRLTAIPDKNLRQRLLRAVKNDVNLFISPEGFASFFNYHALYFPWDV
jgi:hypothetical protein